MSTDAKKRSGTESGPASRKTHIAQLEQEGRYKPFGVTDLHGTTLHNVVNYIISSRYPDGNPLLETIAGSGEIISLFQIFIETGDSKEIEWPVVKEACIETIRLITDFSDKNSPAILQLKSSIRQFSHKIFAAHIINQLDAFSSHFRKSAYKMPLKKKELLELKNSLDEAIIFLFPVKSSVESDRRSGMSLTKEQNKAAATARPDRAGKKVVAGHFDSEIAERIKDLARAKRVTVQSVLEEAIQDLFTKYGPQAAALDRFMKDHTKN